MRTRSMRLGAAVAVFALVAAACGGGDSATDDPPAATQPPAPTTQAPSPTPPPATDAPAPVTQPPATDAPAPPPDTTPPADTAPPATADPSAEPRVLRIGAEDSEGFSLDRLKMTAGEVVTVVFRNTDSGSGEPHNWHLVTPNCVPISGDVCFTNLEEGPDTQELTFTVNTPGEYEFVCDTHLPQMKGILIVEP